jgi:hypothetical protein
MNIAPAGNIVWKDTLEHGFITWCEGSVYRSGELVNRYHINVQRDGSYFVGCPILMRSLEFFKNVEEAKLYAEGVERNLAAEIARSDAIAKHKGTTGTVRPTVEIDISIKWEKIGANEERTKVFGGWILRLYARHMMQLGYGAEYVKVIASDTFIPDAHHAWKTDVE